VAVGVDDADLFEIARAYLARPEGADPVPSPVHEPLLAAMVVGGSFSRAKGLAEAVLAGLGVTASGATIEVRPAAFDLFEPGRSAEMVLHREGRSAERIGVIGEVARSTASAYGLVAPVAAAELRLDVLAFAAELERSLVKPSDFPAVERDINLVVAADVPWGDVEAAVRSAAGGMLESCRLVQVWQDAERLGAGRKSFVISMTLRSTSGTLSGEAAASVVDAVVAECGRRVGGVLRG